MGCTSCGDKPTNTAKDFTKAVIEINNPEMLVLLRKVVIPASISEADNPPAVGKYRNVILKYEDTGNVYLYSSDGIPTAIEANVPQEILDRIEDLESEDTVLHGEIDSLADDLAGESQARTTADNALGLRLGTVETDLAAEILNRTNADTSLGNRITAIEDKIPTQASAQNQLADKNFVNSSVATNTANYISNNGQPFNSLAELEAYTGTLTNNDYAFVVGTDQVGNTTYTRYKYVAPAGEWAEEYVLNNSSFTAAQWAAINSNITSGAVDKLINLADIQSVGANLSLVNSELSATDTTYSAGAGLNLNGTEFSVDTTTIAEKTDIPSIVQVGGTSTTDVMSQKAVSSLITSDIQAAGYGRRIRIGEYAGNTSPSGYPGIAVGCNSNVTGRYGVALGHYAWSEASCGIAIGGGDGTGEGPRVRGLNSIAIGDHIDIESSAAYSVVVGAGKGAVGRSIRAKGSISLGAFSKATSAGEMNIGLPEATAEQQTTYGYNGSEYRLLSGLYDPQSAHDAANKGYVDNSIPATFTTNEWNALWA